MHAAEGYVLGDLTAAQHDAFEEHFADCDACFADVRDGATVAAAVRANGKKKAGRRGYKYIPTLAAAASIALAVVTTGYQQAQIAELRKPRFAPVEVLRDMRGPEDKPVVIRRDVPHTLGFDITD